MGKLGISLLATLTLALWPSPGALAEPSPDPSASLPIVAADIVERALPSVVKIIRYDISGTEEGQGSGFFVAPGRVLTNAHVIEGMYSAEVESPSKHYNKVEVIRVDRHADLALLQVPGRTEPPLELARGAEVRPGERVIAIGNPMGLERTVSDGVVSAVRNEPDRPQMIQISAPISPGSSGGPLLNDRGQVIGVNTQGMVGGQNLNFAVSIQVISQFLDRPDNVDREPGAVNSEPRSRGLWAWLQQLNAGPWQPAFKVLLMLLLAGGLFLGMLALLKLLHRVGERPQPQSRLRRARSDLEKIYRLRPPDDRA